MESSTNPASSACHASHVQSSSGDLAVGVQAMEVAILVGPDGEACTVSICPAAAPSSTPSSSGAVDSAESKEAVGLLSGQTSTEPLDLHLLKNAEPVASPKPERVVRPPSGGSIERAPGKSPARSLVHSKASIANEKVLTACTLNSQIQ